jgi:predicted membrane protein
METNQSRPAFIFISLSILLAALSRLLPHPFNFTPIGAIALFGGAGFSRRIMGFIIPLGAMLLSDVVLEFTRGIGFHATMWAVYLSFALIVCIGFTLKDKLRLSSLILASLSASLLFFLITNFAVWLNAAEYARNLSGLLACYAAAIPFYSQDLFGSPLLNTVMGDLFFSALLFGAYILVNFRFPKLARIKTKR